MYMSLVLPSSLDPFGDPFFILLSTCMQSHITLLTSRVEGVKSFRCNKEGPAYP